MKPGELINVGPFGGKSLYILENRHEKQNLYPFHYHNVHKLLFLISGRGSLILEKGVFPVYKNCFTIIPAGMSHRLEDDKKDLIHLYGIYFTDQIHSGGEAKHLLTGLLQGANYTATIFSIRENPFLARIGLLIREILFEEQNWTAESALLQQGKLIEILILVKRFLYSRQDRLRLQTGQRHLSITEQKVEKIIRYLEKNYYRQFFLEELAAMVPVGKRQFERLFRKLTGTHYTDYLNRVRINRARDLLLDANKDIITVCFDIGFNDLSYFYRTFKKYTGLAPGEWAAEQGGS